MHDNSMGKQANEVAIEYARKMITLSRESNCDASQEEKLFIDIIVQAIWDANSYDQFEKKDALSFFIDGRCKYICDLVALNYDCVIAVKNDLLSGKIERKVKQHLHKLKGLYGRAY